MSGMAKNRSVVELHVADFSKVEQYYSSLGFRIVWRREAVGANGYLVMEFEENVLCFWPGTESVIKHSYFSTFPNDTVRGYGVEIVIFVSDISSFYEKHFSSDEVVEPLVRRPWGVSDFRTIDPNGYYLRFSESFDILDRRLAKD